MFVHKSPKSHLYWKYSLKVSFVSDIISRDRWISNSDIKFKISYNLHFSDNSTAINDKVVKNNCNLEFHTD